MLENEPESTGDTDTSDQAPAHIDADLERVREVMEDTIESLSEEMQSFIRDITPLIKPDQLPAFVVRLCLYALLIPLSKQSQELDILRARNAVRTGIIEDSIAQSLGRRRASETLGTQGEL